MTTPEYNTYAKKLLKKWFKRYALASIVEFTYNKDIECYLVSYKKEILFRANEFNLRRWHKVKSLGYNSLGFIEAIGYLVMYIKKI